MPGVAHVKRCDQCRQSKKKCDQIEPVCGRCQRLGLRCGGAIVKRFKFIPEKFERTPNATGPRNNREKCEKIRAGPVVLRNMSGETMRVAQGFISVLECPSISYDLNLLGTFFKVLPQRMDSSPALKASVAALTSMYRTTRSRGDSTLALTHQGAAMKEIRSALQDPAQARTPNTVLAIYVIMMSQYLFYEIDVPSVPHLQVIAYLLQEAMNNGWIEQFDKDMLLSMFFGILWEAMTNKEVNIDLEFLISLAPYISPYPAGTTDEALERMPGVHTLARMPKWISNPLFYQKQISVAYGLYYKALPGLREQLHKAREAREAPNAPFAARRALAVVLVQLSMITAICALLNKSAQRIDGRNGELASHMREFARDVILVSKLSMEFKPIAAATVPETIIDVWGLIEHGPERDSLEAALWEFCGEATPKWLARGEKLTMDMEEYYIMSLEVAKLSIEG